MSFLHFSGHIFFIIVVERLTVGDSEFGIKELFEIIFIASRLQIFVTGVNWNETSLHAGTFITCPPTRHCVLHLRIVRVRDK